VVDAHERRKRDSLTQAKVDCLCGRRRRRLRDPTRSRLGARLGAQSLQSESQQLLKLESSRSLRSKVGFILLERRIAPVL
jgi:hypothetical protein